MYDQKETVHKDYLGTILLNQSKYTMDVLYRI